MNYLFFDIECCNGYHICSFGYVIIDEEFNIIRKEDFIINPKKKFKLGRANFDPEINLAYTQEVFKQQPEFNYYYGKIKKLLKNNTVLGHSISSDINYLKIACKRYKRPLIHQEIFDTQKLYGKLYKEKDISLEKIANKLHIDISFLIKHKSCDDAHISMLILKEICKQKNCSIMKILKNNKDCFIESDSIYYKKKKEIKNDIMSVAFRKAFKKKNIENDDWKNLFVKNKGDKKL